MKTNSEKEKEEHKIKNIRNKEGFKNKEENKD